MRLSSAVLRAALVPALLFSGCASAPEAPPAPPVAKQLVGTPKPMLPFSPAIKAGGFVYTSGQLGLSRDKPGADIKAQTRIALDAVDALLKAGGSSLARAASVTVFLKNAADVAAMNEVYAGYFTSEPPARTTVIVQALAAPDALVEVAAIGIVEGAERSVILPAGWKPQAAYSYAIKSGNTLFLAGLIARDGRTGAPVPGDIAAQTRTAMDNGAEILKAAGMSYGDVVQSRVWYNAENNRELNPVYSSYFAGVAPPVRAAVRARPPGDYLVEVSMVAVKDPTRTQIVPPNADGTPGAVRPGAFLSSGIKVGNTLYISGMLGVKRGQNEGDIRSQTTTTLDNIERTLKAAGFGWNDLVDALVYINDIARFQDMSSTYKEYLTAKGVTALPVRSTIGVGLGGEVEIMFTAVK